MNHQTSPRPAKMMNRLDLLPLPDAENKDGHRQLKSLIYRSISGYRPLELDLHLPDQASDTAFAPCIIWIHGGAFAMGTKHLVPEFLEEAEFFKRLTSEGFAVASIDYRLSAEALWPAQLSDVLAAVRWLKSRSSELGLDPERFALWGESAGGHLAASAGIRDDSILGSEENPRVSGKVQAVIDWYGPTNFAEMDRQGGSISIMLHDDPQSPESLLLGGPIQMLPELVRDADPSTHVKPGVPAFLIRHGMADRLVPAGQSELLRDSLESVGADLDFALLPGIDHVFEGHPEPIQLLEEAIDFLKNKLGVTE